MQPLSPKSRQNNRKRTSLMITTAIILVTAVVFRGSISQMLAIVQRPLVASGTWFTDRTVGLFRPEIVSVDRVKKLEAALMQLALDRSELDRLQQENQELRGLLSFVDKQRFEHITAAIIGRKLTGQSASFVIDQGSRDGVEIGSPVIVSGGILVGTVSNVSDKTSTVLSIVDPSSAVAATLLNDTRHLGIVQGVSGKLITFRLIPQDEEIHNDDLVITSGLEEKIPSGLVIGLVNEVKSESTDPFQEALIEPLADIRRHSSVSVITKRQPL